MIDPRNIIDVSTNALEAKTMIISNVPDYDFEDYDLLNPKDFKRYITDIERCVRNSFEYRRFIYYLREYMLMNRCSYLSEVTNQDTFGIKIHIHHSPLTLYDIVMAIYNRRCAAKESLDISAVCREVIYNHYMLRIGLIPLSETVHELVHNQFLFIPTNIVYGKYMDFVDLYKDYIDISTLEALDKAQELSKSYTMESANDILRQAHTYIDASDVYGKHELEDVKNSLRELGNSL